MILINFANILPYILSKLHMFLFRLKLSELKSLERTHPAHTESDGLNSYFLHQFIERGLIFCMCNVFLFLNA